jgi:iron complex outermembrane recepter protein
MKRHAGWTGGVLLLTLLSLAPGAEAQRAGGSMEAAPPDTTRPYAIETVVVTAERSARRVERSTGAAAVLHGEQLRRLPLRTVADALQQLPGFAFLDFGGLGDRPQVTVRGFYGGGEAEYVVVLLDGKPINALEGGRVAWDLIPLEAIESIEVLRGGASALYGDAAVGAVVNLTTRSDVPQRIRWSVSAGQHDRLNASMGLNGQVAGRAGSLFADVGRSSGFRDHAARAAGSGGGSVALLRSATRSLLLSTLHHWSDTEEPGPVPGDVLATARTVALPFYRFDSTADRRHRLGLDGHVELRGGATASGYLTAEHRSLDQVRTLPLAPTFADTRNRVMQSTRVLGSAQVQANHLLVRGMDRLLVGADASIGRLSSEYYAFGQGTPATYRDSRFERGALDERGAGSRAAAAGFARYELQPGEALLFALSGRLDRIEDRFEPAAPSEGEATRRTHVAFSPKVGANVRYLDSGGHTGHVYANLARSFKAPTPDQLFDRRPIPVPFPPYRVYLSSAELDPQYGTSAELGLYHRAELVPGSVAGEVSASLYRMEMRDEIDFDMQTFGYINIGRSRHQGVEAGMRLYGPAGIGLTANYTLQDVTARNGENHGSRLKAVPRHFFSGGLDLGAARSASASLRVTRADGLYLDDANTLALPGFTRTDLRLSHPVRGLRLSAVIFNLLDREYSTTGFPDPSGSGIVHYYPAAGRSIEFRIDSAR